MATHVRLALVAALLVAFVGCHKSPTAPSPLLLTGTWVGTGFFPSGTSASFQITQSGSTLTGTWETIGFSGPNGTVNGSANGSSVSVTFYAPGSGASCPFPITVTATVNGNQMTGTWATVNSTCSSTFTLSGNGSWTRQ
jgi:hypothetical protein